LRKVEVSELISHRHRASALSTEDILEGDEDLVLDETYVEDTALSLDKYMYIASLNDHVDDEINHLLYTSIKDIIRYLSKCGVLRSDHTCCTFDLQDIQIIFQFFAEQVINADMDELEALRDELSDWVNDNILSRFQISHSDKEEIEASYLRVSDFIHWVRGKLDCDNMPSSSRINISSRGSFHENQTDKRSDTSSSTSESKLSLVPGDKSSINRQPSSSFKNTACSDLPGIHSLELYPEAFENESRNKSSSKKPDGFILSKASQILAKNFFFKSKLAKVVNVVA
jgi:hypothetical protein